MSGDTTRTTPTRRCCLQVGIANVLARDSVSGCDSSRVRSLARLRSIALWFCKEDGVNNRKTRATTWLRQACLGSTTGGNGSVEPKDWVGVTGVCVFALRGEPPVDGLSSFYVSSSVVGSGEMGWSVAKGRTTIKSSSGLPRGAHTRWQDDREGRRG